MLLLYSVLGEVFNMIVPLLLVLGALLYFIYTFFFKASLSFAKKGIPHISPFEAIKSTIDVIAAKQVFFENVKNAYNKFPDAR